LEISKCMPFEDAKNQVEGTEGKTLRGTRKKGKISTIAVTRVHTRGREGKSFCRAPTR